MDNTEVWKPVVGYEGIYEVSNIGNVRSLDRIDCAGRHLQGCNKSTRVNPSTGYPVVHLCKDGGHKLREVHRLVAEAFIPNPENKREVDHINTVRNDNRVENLKWVTSSENKYNPITNQRMSDWQSDGKSPACGRKIDEKQKRALQEGYAKYVKEHGPPFTNRKHSEETKAKMSIQSSKQWSREEYRDKFAGRSKAGKTPVSQYTLDGEYITTYESANQAAIKTSGYATNIINCCKGKRKNACGYIWKYA